MCYGEFKRKKQAIESRVNLESLEWIDVKKATFGIASVVWWITFNSLDDCRFLTYSWCNGLLCSRSWITNLLPDLNSRRESAPRRYSVIWAIEICAAPNQNGYKSEGIDFGHFGHKLAILVINCAWVCTVVLNWVCTCRRYFCQRRLSIRTSPKVLQGALIGYV